MVSLTLPQCVNTGNEIILLTTQQVWPIEGSGDCEIAGPVNAAGQAYDPAAETYKKQVTDDPTAYTKTKTQSNL